MSTFEVRSTITERGLMKKARHELARMVLDFADEIERLRKELQIERNTNAHRAQ